MPKIQIRKKKNRDKFWYDTRFLDWKIPYFSTYCQISTETTKLKPNQTLLDMAYLNLTSLFFISKETKVFQWFSKSKFLNFMTKVNPNNGNDAKSDIFPWDIFKSDVLYFFGENIKVFQWLLKPKFRSFMTKVNLNNGNERKIGHFQWNIWNLTSFFTACKILKYFNDFFT